MNTESLKKRRHSIRRLSLDCKTKPLHNFKRFHKGNNYHILAFARVNAEFKKKTPFKKPKWNTLTYLGLGQHTRCQPGSTGVGARKQVHKALQAPVLLPVGNPLSASAPVRRDCKAPYSRGRAVSGAGSRKASAK